MHRIAIQLKRAVSLLALAASLASGVSAVHAQIMTSDNYRIPFDDFSAGGGFGSSDNYRLEDTVAEQASPTGEDLSSPDYRACVGYQCLTEAPFLSLILATQAGACSGASASSPPYAVGLGTLTTAAVKTAGNRVCVRVTSNVVATLAVTIASDNAGLQSLGTPAHSIPSGTETLVAANEGYGVCSSNTQGGFSAHAPFNGACNVGANHAVGGLTSAPQTLWTVTAPVDNTFGELLTKASITAVTPAHNDYTDTLTLVVTGTY